jgi:hypothetical protein
MTIRNDKLRKRRADSRPEKQKKIDSPSGDPYNPQQLLALFKKNQPPTIYLLQWNVAGMAAGGIEPSGSRILQDA